jgi:hypothetical protein
MKSIIQDKKECFICGTTYGLELHHCIFGNANRKLSDKYGLTIWLCHEHHTGDSGVHFNKEMDNQIKKLSQERFEEVYGALKSFVEVFGRNFK